MMIIATLKYNIIAGGLYDEIKLYMTAGGVAECCIYLETPRASAIFSVHEELRRCFNCSIS